MEICYGFSRFQDYAVGDRAISLAKEVYRISELLPNKEMFGLRDQMSRAVTSIASNIAEGQVRGSAKEFVRLLYISCGSVAEIQTELILAVEYEYISKGEIQSAISLTVETSRMRYSLIKIIKNRNEM